MVIVGWIEKYEAIRYEKNNDFHPLIKEKFSLKQCKIMYLVASV